jgi:hypothetical protein
MLSERYIKEFGNESFYDKRKIRTFHTTNDGGEIMKKVKPKGERDIEDAIPILWGAIDEAKMLMRDPMLTLEDKRHWAKTLADMVGVLNKIHASQGKKQLEDEDLGSLLTKVPKELRTIVRERARIWREKSS